MKLAVVVLTLLFVCYTHQADDDGAKYLANKDKCVKESGVDPSVLDAAVSVANYKDNQPFKCYLKCMLVGYGGMTEDGELVEEMYKKSNFDVPMEQWSQLVDTCKSVKGSDPCETAYLLSVCVEDTMKNF